MTWRRLRGLIRPGFVVSFCLGALCTPGWLAAQQTPSPRDLEGVWAAERYEMASGDVYRVEGRIIFGAQDWQVLFFVVDSTGTVRRGSGEGGTWTLREGQVVFTHLFHLSAGEAMPGLPAADLRMLARPVEGAPTEPTDLRLEGDRLLLHFPSGNRMIFRRR